MTKSSWIPPDMGGPPDLAVRIRASFRMLIPVGKRHEARNILTTMIRRIKLEEGCLSCRLYQDVMGGKNLLFEEIWTDEKSFQKHLRSDEFRNVLLVVEMASKPPEIHFDRIAQSTGIESIKHISKRSDTPPDGSKESLF